LLLNFALEYIIRRVQAKGESLKLNSIYQLLVYADNGSIHTTQKNTEALLDARRKIDLEIYAEKTNYKVMY
jgi:hypothetical protein